MKKMIAAGESVRGLRAGFTLMELLVVVAILAILGAIGAKGVIGNIEKARATAAKTGVDNIKEAVATYHIEKGKFPTLEQLISAEGDDEPMLDGGEGALVDPWGTQYKLEIKGKKRVIVISAGPDGEFGTEDDVRSDKIDTKKKE